MFSALSFEQRQAIKEHGVPLAAADNFMGKTYILLSVQVMAGADLGNFTARIPGIDAFGDGETEQDATLALCEAIRGYLDAFGNR